MKFFLDTANLNEIREAASYGIADGVTTNPSLIAKEGDVDFKQHIAAICELVQGPVSAEVTSLDKALLGQPGHHPLGCPSRCPSRLAAHRWPPSAPPPSPPPLPSWAPPLIAVRAR